MNTNLMVSACVAACALAGCMNSGPAADEVCDVVIYGSSPAAISAAIQAKRMGRSAVVVSPETRIGGLTTGGLGQTVQVGSENAKGIGSSDAFSLITAYQFLITQTSHGRGRIRWSIPPESGFSFRRSV